MSAGLQPSLRNTSPEMVRPAECGNGGPSVPVSSGTRATTELDVCLVAPGFTARDG